MNHLIVGTGPLGLAIMDELIAQGESVTLVNRRGTLNEPLPTGVRLVAGDATYAGQVARLAQTHRSVFVCVGLPYTQWVSHFPAVIQGIIDGVSQSDAVLVFGDNLYLYGDTHGQPMHEDLPALANGRKGRLRAEMSQQILLAHQQGKVRSVIGRASDYYGPRVTLSALGDRFFPPALTGKTVSLMGRLDQPHTFSFIRDVASSLVTLSQQPDAWGQAWHLPNAAPLTYRQLINLTEGFIHRPIRVSTASRLLLRTLGLFDATIRELDELYYEFDQPFLVSHARYQKAFGAYPTPWEDGLRETIDWYNHQSAPPVAVPVATAH